MLSDKENMDNVLYNVREMLAPDGSRPVELKPTLPPRDCRPSVQYDEFRNLRDARDEFMRRLNKALWYYWRPAQPDADSECRHVKLEAPGGRRLTLKSTGQAQFHFPGGRVEVIAHDRPEDFDAVIEREGEAFFPLEPEYFEERWISIKGVTIFSAGVLAVILLSGVVAQIQMMVP